VHLIGYNKIVYRVEQGMNSSNNVIKLLYFFFRARTQTGDAAAFSVRVRVFAPFLKWLESITVLTEFKSAHLCHLVKNTVEILEVAGLSETSIITNFTRCDICKTLLRV
jgi:hypothetical protein